MATLKTIGKDEAFSTTCNVNGKNATLAFAVKPSEKFDTRFAVETVLNFAGVTEAEIIELACSTLRIDLQRRFRTMYLGKEKAEALKAETWAKMSVRTILDTERKKEPADPVMAARKRMDALKVNDPKAFDALMAEYETARRAGNNKKAA